MSAAREHHRILPVLATLAAAVVACCIWRAQLQQSMSWRDAFAEAQVFGRDCGYAVDTWRSNDSFRTAAARGMTLTPLAMPYRGAPTEKIPVVKPGQYLLTRCTLDARGFERNGFAWVSLGNVFGDSAVFLGDHLVATQADNGLLEFPLPPDLRGGVLTLTLVSRPTAHAASTGLASLLPLFVTSSRRVVDGVHRSYRFFEVESPIFRLGFALSLCLFFAVSWQLGIRYADVGWMVVVTSLFCLDFFTAFVPVGANTLWRYHAWQAFQTMEVLALAAFIVSFLRLTISERTKTTLFVSLSAVYAAATWLMPGALQLHLAWRYGVPFLLGGGLFLVIGVVAFQHARLLPTLRRRKVVVVGAVTLAAAACYLLQGVFLRSTAVNLGDYLNLAFATVFASFLVADLVVFRRRFFLEQTRRALEELEKAELGRRLELGRSVQEILLPNQRTGERNGFSYRFHHAPAQTMAGDWFQVWHDDHGSSYLLFGDVMGKGPQAAIVVATIQALLFEAKRTRLSMAEAIRHLDQSLLALFGGKTWTTLCAAVLHANHDVELFSCATGGWIHRGRDNARRIQQRSGPLGIGGEIDVEPVRMTLAEGDMLVSFTDGMLEGTRPYQRLLRSLTGAKLPLSLAEVTALVEAAGGASDGGEDDRTMVVVSREAGLEGEAWMAAG